MLWEWQFPAGQEQHSSDPFPQLKRLINLQPPAPGCVSLPVLRAHNKGPLQKYTGRIPEVLQEGAALGDGAGTEWVGNGSGCVCLCVCALLFCRLKYREENVVF